MKRVFSWLNDSLEEFLMAVSLILMMLIMGIQVFSRYALGASLSWSEELTRYIFVWAGFLSVSYCTKKCVSIKIEQFVAMFPRRGKAVFKLVNHTFELIFFFYLNMERITNCPEAVKEGSKAPGSTDTIPREMDTGIAMTRHITKIINTTTADMFSPPPFCFSLLQIFFPAPPARSAAPAARYTTAG